MFSEQKIDGLTYLRKCAKKNIWYQSVKQKSLQKLTSPAICLNNYSFESTTTEYTAG